MQLFFWKNPSPDKFTFRLLPCDQSFGGWQQVLECHKSRVFFIWGQAVLKDMNLKGKSQNAPRGRQNWQILKLILSMLSSFERCR